MLKNIPAFGALACVIITLCISPSLAISCSADKLSLYIKLESKGERKSIDYTDGIYNICPTLHISCCTVTELTTASEQFQLGKKSVAEHFELVKAAAEAFEKVEKTTLIQTFNGIKNQAAPEEQLNEAQFNEDVKEFINNRSEYQIEFHKLGELIKRYYSGFICEFCSSGLNRFLLPTSAKKGYYTLRFDVLNVQKFSDLMTAHYKFFDKLSPMRRVFNALSLKSNALKSDSYKKNIDERIDFIKRITEHIKMKDPAPVNNNKNDAVITDEKLRTVEEEKATSTNKDFVQKTESTLPKNGMLMLTNSVHDKVKKEDIERVEARETTLNPNPQNILALYPADKHIVDASELKKEETHSVKIEEKTEEPREKHNNDDRVFDASLSPHEKLTANYIKALYGHEGLFRQKYMFAEMKKVLKTALDVISQMKLIKDNEAEAIKSLEKGRSLNPPDNMIFFYKQGANPQTDDSPDYNIKTTVQIVERGFDMIDKRLAESKWQTKFEIPGTKPVELDEGKQERII